MAPPRLTTLPAARLIALISLAAGALGDSCVGLGCLTRGEHFWRGTDADGQPLLLNLVFSADKLSASGTLTTGTNTSEPFEATVSEEASELLITWSAGVQEWSGIVVAMDPGSLLLHGSEGTIDSLTLSSPIGAGATGESAMVAVKPQTSMQSLVQLSAPGSTIRMRDDAAGERSLNPNPKPYPKPEPKPKPKPKPSLSLSSNAKA